MTFTVTAQSHHAALLPTMCWAETCRQTTAKLGLACICYCHTGMCVSCQIQRALLDHRCTTVKLLWQHLLSIRSYCKCELMAYHTSKQSTAGLLTSSCLQCIPYKRGHNKPVPELMSCVSSHPTQHCKHFAVAEGISAGCHRFTTLSSTSK